MTAFIWIANILGWPLIHLLIAWIVLRRPIAEFTRDSFLMRERSWEAGGGFYRRWIGIHRWKSMLPDGAPWVGGISKKRLAQRDRAYLYNFMLETRRAELAHWCMIACLPVFFIWNPPWARWIMTAYAVAANAPCILAQRYNRAALVRLIRRMDRASSGVELSRPTVSVLESRSSP